MIIVYLSSNYIRIVEGEYSRGSVRIRRLCKVEDPNGSVVNGVLVDAEQFRELISSMWETYSFPKKNVGLVINSSQFTTKVIQVPLTNQKQTLEYVSREFADVERMESPVCSYFTMPDPPDTKEKKGKKKKASTKSVFAAVAPRGFLKEYYELFESMGIHISRMDVGRGSALRMFCDLDSLRGRTCIVQALNDAILLNIMISNGEYVYSGRNRLFTEPGTPEFAVEIARSLSNVLQFAKTQNMTEKITEIYASGIDRDVMEIYMDSVHRIDEEIQVSHLDLGKSVSFDAGIQQDEISEYVTAIAGMWPLEDKVGFVSQLAFDPEKEEKRKQFRKVAVPVGILAGVFLALSLILGVQHVLLRMELKSVQAYNESADVVQACKDYDLSYGRVIALQGFYGSGTGLKSSVEAYPMVDSEIVKVVSYCAKGLVEAQISGYQSDTGILTFDTNASDINRINRFIALLEEQEVFASVDYTGYRQDSKGNWKVQVDCRMSGRQEESDDAETDREG